MEARIPLIAFFCLLVLIAWEALYFAGFIDPVYHYHPLGSLQILFEVSFLRDFGLMSLQFVVASCVGGAIAGSVGPLIPRGSRLVGPTMRFLRIGMWIPFIIYWALPLWSPWKFTFGRTFAMTSLVSVSVVALSGIYYYLVSRDVLNLKQEDARWWLLRTAILQALFISVFCQLWLLPYGWHWYDFRVGGAYAASMLILLLVFIIERSLRTRFDFVSEVRGNILVRELNPITLGTLLGSILITLLLALIWQVLSLSSLEMILSSPRTVLGVCYHLLFQGTFWQDVYVSFSEVFGGLILGTGAAWILYRLLFSHNYLREELFPLLPLMHITLFFSPVVLMWWLGGVGYWQKSLGIGLMTIYPTLEAIWGLRDRAPGLRLLLAIDNGLPYAVVMMLFSEAMAATAGLGFSMLNAHVKSETVPEGIAIALIIIALLVVHSSTLRCLAKRLYSGNIQLVLNNPRL